MKANPTTYAHSLRWVRTRSVRWVGAAFVILVAIGIVVLQPFYIFD
jgi:uncharacterized membrane protein